MSEQSLVPIDHGENPHTLLEDIFGASASGDPAVLEDFQKIQAVAEEITYDQRRGSAEIILVPFPVRPRDELVSSVISRGRGQGTHFAVETESWK